MAAMLIGGVQLRGSKMRGARAVRIVAVLAYCLYLVHYPLIPLATAIAHAYGDSTTAFWCAYLTLSGAAAAVLHVFVERPCMLHWGSSRSWLTAFRNRATADGYTSVARHVTTPFHRPPDDVIGLPAQPSAKA